MRAVGAYGVPFRALPAPLDASLLLERGGSLENLIYCLEMLGVFSRRFSRASAPVLWRTALFDPEVLLSTA